MRKVTVACVQMSCCADREKNIEKALSMSSEAARDGANLILLPELFERPYFCQERRYENYAFAEETGKNGAVAAYLGFTRDTGTAAVVSFYEKDGNLLYNSAAVIEKGNLLGVYRKTHIPDDHYYQEKFYFTPGNTGFKTFNMSFGKIGVGICWDQWFPETARALALHGAEIILFPTAIGSEPILGTDSRDHWQRVMQGHAAANLVPVAAANRYGREEITPCGPNGGQTSSLDFYGSSFITDNTGKIVNEAGRSGDSVVAAEFDLDALERERLEWGLFRDRRPDMYRFVCRRGPERKSDTATEGNEKKTKFYALKSAEKSGIYTTWDECREEASRHPDAKYKAFPTEAEARAFIDGTDIIYGEQIKPYLEKGYAVAYTDGSFDSDLNAYSYGVCIFAPGTKERVEMSGTGNRAEYVSSHNIAGEIQGVTAAITWARDNAYRKLIVYHDYEGLGKWVRREFSAKSVLSQKFVEYVDGAKKDIEIEFIKVDGHMGNRYNERADALARAALAGKKRQSES